MNSEIENEYGFLKSFIPDILVIAYKAGEAILDVYNSKEFDVTFKDDSSPLTIADKRANDIIVAGLSGGQFRNIPVLSEEGKTVSYDERKSWEYFWCVDPLDGTKEFIKRNDEFTVNIALIHKHRPVLGVIYIPVKDIFYFASEGLGSYKLADSKFIANTDNFTKEKKELLNEVINLSVNLYPTTSPLPSGERGRVRGGGAEHVTAQINIIGSGSHATKEQELYVGEIKKRFDKVEFSSAGSSLKFCNVAEGKADIYPRFGPTMEWDTAAGQAIVEQSGGKVLNIRTKEPLAYNKKELLNPWFLVVKGNYQHEKDVIDCTDLLFLV
ncbi:MAG: 3'(2'),5'-bisphosphate nucleotidase CysQ [Nitrospirae bacterium]|nr:3'(2'),5'-bisphosphate nucleotidase CysQ [Nitrospirota bacterium]